ncbi:MAG: ethanolamine ammonia-lyase subunit EutC [Burkholderiales bacterium]|nr:ethanolamine ammonia-lyase subunit EutC [Burkholderiales bacterium]
MTAPVAASGIPVRQDPWRELAAFTPARIALGRAGGSVPTRPLLEFQLAHAQAKDAVRHELDVDALALDLDRAGFDTLRLHSAAPDRHAFIARPDLGRILDDASRALLGSRAARDAGYDAVLVVADGLSALGIERHVPALLGELAPRLAHDGWSLAPIAIVRQGRVAIGDEIGALLGARMSVVLIGERPGLSSPDSAGAYLTYDPLPGRTNAERNCISNIRAPHGLCYPAAAHKLLHLMAEARRRRLSGIALKEDAAVLECSLAADSAPRIGDSGAGRADGEEPVGG